MENSIKRSPIGTILVGVICTIVLSSYFFPFGFTFFLPKTFNTKIGLAVIGIIILGYHCVIHRKVVFDKELIPPVLIAVLFSIYCFIIVDLNQTDDYSYATYVVSFATWYSAAYATYSIMKIFYPVVTIKTLFFYLTLVCGAQCILALVIHNFESFKIIIDRYIAQSTVADADFLNKVDRLYGIGAALDPAGTRFSIVLACIGSLLGKGVREGQEDRTNLFYWISFLIIGIIGNIISRTTSIGLAMGLLLFLIESGIINTVIKQNTLRVFGKLIIPLLIAMIIGWYYYNNNAEMRDLFRYGFEGFFNWVEKGEWSTNSTDMLMDAWKWPDTTWGWVFGYGLFDNWVFDTDIGYCRFVLYCGIIGLFIFSLFFTVNAWVCCIKFPSYFLLFLFLLALTFFIWVKVSTDLFLIYGLFFCIDEAKDRRITINTSF